MRKGIAVAAGAVLAPLVARQAAAQEKQGGMMGGKPMMSGMPMMGAVGEAAADGYVIRATVRNHCGTCEYWGGPRRISADGRTLTITGLGWCNNPDSPNYRKETTPDHGPMSTWHKWGALS